MNQRILYKFTVYLFVLLSVDSYGMEKNDFSFPIQSSILLAPKGTRVGMAKNLYTLSPQVHNFTWQCTLQDLKNVHYNITAFKVQISFERGDEQAIVKKILEMNLSD